MRKNLKKIRTSQTNTIKQAFTALKTSKDTIFSETNVAKHRTNKAIINALNVKEPVREQDIIILSPKNHIDSN